jgi:hypothetical protein
VFARKESVRIFLGLLNAQWESLGPMIQINYLVVFCLGCRTEQNKTPIIEDELGDDCLVRQAVKNWREENKGKKCSCGGRLIPRYATNDLVGVN